MQRRLASAAVVVTKEIACFQVCPFFDIGQDLRKAHFSLVSKVTTSIAKAKAHAGQTRGDQHGGEMWSTWLFLTSLLHICTAQNII